MSTYLKRQKVPKKWPIARKGSTYVVKPGSNLEKGVPILIVLRDMMEIAQNRKEVKRAVHLKQLLVNGNVVRDEKKTVLLLDTMTIVPMKKSYRLDLGENGKFYLEEIKESEAGKKMVKIVDKKILKGKKVQLNFYDGGNILSDVKCEMNDSALVDLKAKKIEKIIPLKEKAKILVFAGKHIGEKGEIKSLNKEEKTAMVKFKDREVNILIKQIMAVE